MKLIYYLIMEVKKLNFFILCLKDKNMLKNNNSKKEDLSVFNYDYYNEYIYFKYKVEIKSKNFVNFIIKQKGNLNENNGVINSSIEELELLGSLAS